MKLINFDTKTTSIVLVFVYLAACAVSVCLTFPGTKIVLMAWSGIAYGLVILLKAMVASFFTWLISGKKVSFCLAFSIIVFSALINEIIAYALAATKIIQ
ncbi:hypothetical protein LJC46_09860 [Desulfovibrio sp. OttesenSCG-928-G15]|nr:hypothetical protein [Desulfovibrio sp. OttesenSCG-928-G15]